jgi:hypothetical protein
MSARRFNALAMVCWLVSLAALVADLVGVSHADFVFWPFAAASIYAFSRSRRLWKPKPPDSA